MTLHLFDMHTILTSYLGLHCMCTIHQGYTAELIIHNAAGSDLTPRTKAAVVVHNLEERCESTKTVTGTHDGSLVVSRGECVMVKEAQIMGGIKVTGGTLRLDDSSAKGTLEVSERGSVEFGDHVQSGDLVLSGEVGEHIHTCYFCVCSFLCVV